MNVKKAVIPAAGLGTRFLPATKAQPKEMLPIVDKPAIQYVVEEAVRAGIEDILIVTGRHKRAIEDHFDRSYELERTLEDKEKYAQLNMVRDVSELADIHYIRQKTPRGLGDAVRCAKAFVGDEHFAVLLGDDILIEEDETPAIGRVMKDYKEVQASTLLVREESVQDLTKYGIVEIDQHGRVQHVVEKPKERPASRWAITGRYVLTPAIFDEIDQQQEIDGEIQLTAAIGTLLQKEAIFAQIYEGKRYDIGDQIGYIKANIELASQRDDLGEPLQAYIAHLLSH
ncbi:UTP--glucose-1-phosphate uridylyltransferase [Pontibacillus halophilus JSM 076056 = DSM 19796]|uniref:UTP--glucose-1-phosphate uridylyltransferase n=1 Tax=Pontibacillus halophilus JSM 076056 = DSM 19796 TaxID=1385510 RepID=A0A0A5GH55_9BACI|nr:UTP--glucose-1-phosphate uridylyltransferase GalU [Pontibacillus halophilus]KGX91364.1 UTP--glucose-1-phosphate uridylyltransferase [Pontibacillus halophilus JSM 076056 = DSM 19796]